DLLPNRRDRGGTDIAPDPRLQIGVHPRKRRRHRARSSPPNQYTPTVVWAAIPRHGFTPLTPSHGYFSYGFLRMPSSRSANRGTKNSFVSVVSSPRPQSPYGTTFV